MIQDKIDARRARYTHIVLEELSVGNRDSLDEMYHALIGFDAPLPSNEPITVDGQGKVLDLSLLKGPIYEAVIEVLKTDYPAVYADWAVKVEPHVAALRTTANLDGRADHVTLDEIRALASDPAAQKTTIGCLRIADRLLKEIHYKLQKMDENRDLFGVKDGTLFIGVICFSIGGLLALLFLDILCRFLRDLVRAGVDLVQAKPQRELTRTAVLLGVTVDQVSERTKELLLQVETHVWVDGIVEKHQLLRRDYRELQEQHAQDQRQIESMIAQLNKATELLKRAAAEKRAGKK